MRTRAAIASLLLVGGLGVAAAPAATAATAAFCYGEGYGYDTYTYSDAPTCNVQSRITRYYGSVAYNYYGPNGTTSYVTATNGVNAGNAVRFNLGAWDTFSGHVLWT